MRKYSLISLTALIIASCGGGSGGGEIVNLPPRLTSSLNVSVSENDASFVYTATATDPEGNAVTISLQPTGDAARFNFDENSNQLRFAAAPDFENPDDSNGDNVYNLTFRVTDGSFSPLVNVNVTVTDVNEAPQFSSANITSAEENTSDPVYTAEANDQDGNTLSYNISGGPDAAAFSIDRVSGQLSFTPVVDFERPSDDNADNIYELTLEVSDGALTDEIDLSVEVTNVEQNIQVRRVASGLRLPLYVAGLPDGTNRIVILEKFGRMRLVNPDTGEIGAVDFLDIQGDISTVRERGLLGVVFSPDFQNDGVFYINCTNLAGDTEFRKYTTFPGELDRADPASKDVILTVAQPAANHNGGWLGFTPDGLMLIPFGDGGDLNTSQNDNLLLGKVVRIDVSRDDFPADDLRDYAIPAGNTFEANPAAGLPEIYAKGLRNPFRASFDPISGDLIIADVGGQRKEEINRLPLDDNSRNFGWPLVEGTLPLRGTQTPDLTLPVSEYDHGAGERQGESIIGGYVYRGPVEALQDSYIFGDFVNEFFWSVPVRDLVDGQVLSSDAYNILTDDFVPDVSDYNLVSSFGEDEQGNIYIASYFGGEIFRMEAE